MTVETQTTDVTATGNGSATSFSFSPLVIFASTDIEVSLLTIADGTRVALSEGTGASAYSVTVASYPGTGSITYPQDTVTPIASTHKIIIKRVLTLEQTVDLENQGGYFPDVQETVADKAVMIDLQQQEEIDRSFKFPLSYTGSASLEWPVPVAGAYVRWNLAGDALESTSSAVTQFLAPAGSAATPGLAFTGDVDSGWYRIGANNVGLSLGGTKRVDYATTGVSVTGTITSSGILSVDDATDTTSGTSGSIHTDGGVGIAKKLHVIGTTTHGGDVLSDTDSTDSLGSTGVRWLKAWVDSIQTTADIDVGANLIVAGNLTVNGSTVTNDATNTVIKDPLIELNTGASSNANDLGFIFERGSTGNNGFFGWDESGDHFVAATTTATGSSTGNISYSLADLKVGAVSATSGTLAGLTSLAMSAGATLTDGFLDEDNLGSNSAVAGVTQQSVKAYVDAAIKAPGIQMTWEANTADSDQGAGKIWANNATLSSATVLYIDDVDKSGVSINAFVDTLDDPTATNSALIYVAEAGSGSAGVVFAVSGGVVSASTYSKITVSHVATIGTLSDADVVGMVIAYSGNNGSINSVADDTTPQLGGFLDTNDKFVSFSQGANIASVAGDTNIWGAFDGNTVHITGTNAITDFGTPKQAGDSMWVIFDAAASVVDSATITVAGNTNFQAAANDLALVYALSTSTFLFVPFKNDGTSTVASVVSDTTPQLGGFLDANSKFISQSQGANIASVAGDTDIWANFDGNTVHITGTNAITDFGTPKSAGDHMWVIFDGAASVVDSATITVDGNTNFQAATNDLALVYALTTSTFLFKPFKNDGTSTVAAAGGAWTLISNNSPSAAASLSLTGFDSSAYDAYCAVISNLRPATNSQNLWLRTSTDGGSSYETSGYQYHIEGKQSGDYDRSNSSTSESHVKLSPTAEDIGNATTAGISGVLWLYGPHAAARFTTMTWSGVQVGDSSEMTLLWGSGMRETAADVDGLQLLFSSGNIADGDVQWYGIKYS
jgi:hypothetical protein